MVTPTRSGLSLSSTTKGSRSGTRGETRVVALKSSDILRAQMMPLRNLASLLSLALLCMAAANLGMAQEHVQ